ncbi:MAG: 23S rRNA (adenine(1618)-N(6))-methyltransferase RlmF [Cytophagales bacterium]|nr:23S rRNA (adenine(1618)-N(6))-methyltransferase RlmF [Cytophagales bacterium]
MHPRNPHLGRYDFEVLKQALPALAEFIRPNKYGDDSIDFANPGAVKALNSALLKCYYDINYWDVPPGYLSPPIPGRADYIHHIADLLCTNHYGRIPTGPTTKCLDIGVGASCIYPIIGNKAYGWSFIGSDIDQVSLESAKKITEENITLKGKVEFRWQTDPKDIFYGVIRKEERIDVTICNPPFHSSAEETQAGTMRKLNNLNKERITKPVLNFGGQNSELWCEGGEKRFVKDMIRESKKFSETCFWYSTLVSKQSNVRSVEGYLRGAKATEVRVIPMGQGNKTSRIIAWTFLNKGQQKAWRDRKAHMYKTKQRKLKKEM